MHPDDVVGAFEDLDEDAPDILEPVYAYFERVYMVPNEENAQTTRVPNRDVEYAFTNGGRSAPNAKPVLGLAQWDPIYV